MLELHNFKHCIFGVQGSGKTFFVKHLTQGFKKPTVYRMNSDFDSENVYLYKPVDYFAELDAFIDWFIKSDHDLLILDEADLILSNNALLLKNPKMHDLILNHRHHKKTLLFLSRRPQDMPTKIVESCRYTFWFKVGNGANINRKLREIDERLPELMEKLQFQDYKFIIHPIGEAPYIHNAVSSK